MIVTQTKVVAADTELCTEPMHRAKESGRKWELNVGTEKRLWITFSGHSESRLI